MKSILVQKNPFPNPKCEKKSCLLCESNKPGGKSLPCNSSNVGYRLNCDTCSERGLNKVYEGETSRSARVRASEHLRDFKKGKHDSSLFKHKQNDHQNEEMKFSMSITKKFRDPLTRQANEAVRISNRKKSEIRNSKNESNHPPISRIVVEKTKKSTSQNVGPSQSE